MKEAPFISTPRSQCGGAPVRRCVKNSSRAGFLLDVEPRGSSGRGGRFVNARGEYECDTARPGCGSLFAKVVSDFSRPRATSSVSVKVHSQRLFAKRSRPESTAICRLKPRTTFVSRSSELAKNDHSVLGGVCKYPQNRTSRSGRPSVNLHATTSRSGRPSVNLHTTTSRSGRPSVNPHTTSARSGGLSVNSHLPSNKQNKP